MPILLWEKELSDSIIGGREERKGPLDGSTNESTDYEARLLGRYRFGSEPQSIVPACIILPVSPLTMPYATNFGATWQSGRVCMEGFATKNVGPKRHYPLRITPEKEIG